MIGGKTLTVWSEQQGNPDRKGIPAKSYIGAQVHGCQIQPRSVKEDVTNIDYAIRLFNIFAPATETALAVKTTDYVQDGPISGSSTITDLTQVTENGQIYRVIGAKRWNTLSGRPHHVTIEVEIPSGTDLSWTG